MPAYASSAIGKAGTVGRRAAVQVDRSPRRRPRLPRVPTGARTGVIRDWHGGCATPAIGSRACVVAGAAVFGAGFGELVSPACAALSVDEAPISDPVQAARAALHAIAVQVQALTPRSAVPTSGCGRSWPAPPHACPRCTVWGPEVAGQLLATAGDNPHRLRPEAALAHLCGVAPTRQLRARRSGTASTDADTEPPTTPDTPSPCPGCATTPARRRTWIAVPNRA